MISRFACCVLALAFVPLAALAAPAGGVPPDRTGAPTDTPSTRYVADTTFFKLPKGRTMGASSAVYGDSKGHIWMVDRCAANDCAGSKLNPIMEFGADGRFIKSFGAGLLLFPHGFTIDAHDNLWITDGHVNGKMGDVVREFSPDGKLLRTLGKPGVSGNGHDTFHEPSAVLVAPDGSIFVGDGHTPGKGNARIVKFDRNGKYLMQWGGHGQGPGQFEMPHSLALDSKGRLYVADRGNNRIQIFTQNGKYLGQMHQFSRNSGIFIDKNDILYATDSESGNSPGYGHNPGWKRGIRIGSLADGVVTDFIPVGDPDAKDGTTSGGEGIWADGRGHVYSAQVKQMRVVRYTRR
jgi:sugar lactone lactonase YvrE